MSKSSKANGNVAVRDHHRTSTNPFVVTQSKAVSPPAEFYIHLDIRRKARVLTHKLPGSPDHMYSVYFGANDIPVLELISYPDKSDIINAIARRKP